MENLIKYLYEGVNDEWKAMKSTLTALKSYKTIYKSGETSVDLIYSYLYFSHPLSSSMIEAINDNELKKAANDYTNNPQSFPSFKLVIYSSESDRYSWIKRGMSYDGVSNKTVKAGDTYIELHIRWGDNKSNMPNLMLTSDAIQYDFKDIKDFIKNYVKSNVCKDENTFINFVKSLNKMR
jgi:hypothetical protein